MQIKTRDHGDNYHNSENNDSAFNKRLNDQRRNRDLEDKRYDQRRTRDNEENRESDQRTQQKQDQEQCRSNNGQQQDDNPSDTLCIGCWKYGHPVEECTKTGAYLAIDAFLQQFSEQTKKEIKAAYRKNGKEAHERYLRAFKHRQELRKKIRRLEYQYHHDSSSAVKQNDRAAVAELDALRISCICVAHDEDLDLNFGSLDHHYLDNNELMLQFDPSVEDFPTDNK